LTAAGGARRALASGPRREAAAGGTLGGKVAIALVGLTLLWPLRAAAGAAEQRATLLRLEALRGALERQRGATGELPRNAKQLTVVARLYAPGVPVQRGAAVDGWGRAFVYVPAPGRAQGYLLYSSGANGVDESGGGDDLGAGSAGESDAHAQGVQRALQLLPLLSLLVLAPVAWGFIRAARRGIS
jgi:type II secretory pathway pseudopilin PulG